MEYQFVYFLLQLSTFSTGSWSKPLYILSHSRAILKEAIKSDATFLEKNYVMDYSLLLGLDSDENCLVVGIIGKQSNCTV